MLLGLEPVPPPVGGREVLGMNRPGKRLPPLPLPPAAPPPKAQPAPVVTGRVPAHVRTPLQRAMWSALAEGPATAAELAVELGTSVNATSMALGRWRDQGWLRVTMVVTGRSRPAQLFERLEEE